MNKTAGRLFIVSGGVLLATNLLLSYRIGLIRDEAASVLRRHQSSLQPLAGASVPSLRGYSLSGDPIALDHDGSRHTLLLIVALGCRACDDVWREWWQLVSEARHNGLRVAVVNLSLDRPWREHKALLGKYEAPGVVVFGSVEPESQIAYNLRLTPQLVLISPEGRIEKVHSGSLRTIDRAKLAAFARPPR
ncbi:MAG TPA: hypothetical protein VNI83_04165 [Vicinamibacterales bacterium]|nr:hypothetical protein [Vicinamibacterales bacterium]